MIKHCFLLLLFIVFSVNLFSQPRIGATEYEILKEFYQEKFDKGYTKDGVKWISFDNGLGVMLYYINEDNVCNYCFLVPHNQEIINNIVQRYNEEYVIISETKWKKYTSRGIMNILLMFKDNGYLFAYF